MWDRNDKIFFMKILFINPPLHNFLGGCHSETTPLGLMYLAAILEKNNYEAKILDAERLLMNWDDLALKIKTENPNIIGIGGMTLGTPAILKTAAVCKNVLPNVKIMVGGAGPTFEPERMLQKESAIDLVVRFEAENNILDIINYFTGAKDIKDVKGIAYQEAKQIIINPPAEYVKDLDSIPLPAYHLLEPSFSNYSGMHRGFAYYGMQMPNAVIMASRGCPHRCIFCSNHKTPNRRRDPKKIVDEIEFCLNLGAKSIQFYDDEFIGTSPVQNSWVEAICDEIIARNLQHISYLVQGRCSPFIKLEILQKMKTAGFKWVWWGVESGSQKMLDLMKKDTTLADIKNTFKIAHAAGLKSLMFIIIGLPGETKKDVYETGRLIENVNPDQVRFHIITPFPGSDLWEKLKAKNQIEDYDFLHYNTRFSAVHHTDELSAKEIENLYKMMVLRYESNKKNLLKVMLKSFYQPSEWKNLLPRLQKVFKIIPQWIKIKL